MSTEKRNQNVKKKTISLNPLSTCQVVHCLTCLVFWFVTSTSPFYYSHLMVCCFYRHLLTKLAQFIPAPAFFHMTVARLHVKVEKAYLYACERQSIQLTCNKTSEGERKVTESVSKALRRVKYECGKCPSVFKQP